MNLIESINEKYKEVSDFLEDDSTQILGDISKVLKIFINTRKLYKEKKFIKFLKGLEFEDMNSNQVEKLSKYIKNKTTSEYLIQYIEKMLGSMSYLACFLIGMYTSILINKDKEIDYEATNILGFLLEANDFDIKNLKKLDNYFSEKNKTNIDYTGYEELKDIEIPREEISTLIEKCIRYSLLDKYYYNESPLNVEEYQPTHPLDSGFRVEDTIEITQSIGKTETYEVLIDLVNKCPEEV